MSFNKSQDFAKLLKLVNKVFYNNEQRLTSNKKLILKILFNQEDHLSIEDIVNLSSIHYGKKLDTTSTYRILSNLENFDIVNSIILNDNKKRYELAYLKKPHYHLYCQYCNKITEFYNLDIHNKFLSKLKNINFKPTNFNVIINGICETCTI